MPISVTCTNCDQSYTVRDENAGRTFKCKSCGESVTVPTGASPRGSRSSDSQERRTGTSGSRSRSDRRSPSRKKQATRKQPRRPVEQYDEYDYDDDDDSYEAYDEGPSRGGGRRGGGRVSGRARKRSRSGGTKRQLQTGLLLVAVSTCVYAAAYSAIVFIKLLALFNSTSMSSISTLSTGHVWLNFLGILGMVGGYIFCLLGPDRGSRNLVIAALSTGVIAVGLVFFMQILPRFDGGNSVRQLEGLAALGLIGGGSLWESVFKRLLLEALFLSHLVLFLFAVRELVSSRLESSSSFALIPIAAYGGLTVLNSLYRIFLVKVILPNAMKNLEAPSRFWNWLNSGLDWLSTAAMVVFLILYLRVLFQSRSDV